MPDFEKAAESFGAEAARYHRTRPRYPDEMVKAVVDAMPGTDVLDVGIGTGIAAAQLRAAGCRVLGLDPDARMAEFARAAGFDVEIARIEDWDPAGRAFDAVTAAQAWHWVDPVEGAAKAAQALKPGGRLAAFWNVAETPDDVDVAFRAVYHEAAPELEHYRQKMPGMAAYSVAFVKVSQGIEETEAFDPPELWRFEWERAYTKDEWLDQLPTFGDHSQLSPAQLEQVLSGIGAAIDELGGSFTMPMTAVVVTAAKRS